MLCTCLLPELKTAAASNNTYDQYLADFIVTDEYAKSYMTTDCSLPYRTFVEGWRNDTENSVALAAWEALTFDGNIVGYNEKLIAYYQTILFDIILGNDEELPAIETMKSVAENTKLDVFKTVVGAATSTDEEALEEFARLKKLKPTDAEYKEMVANIKEMDTFSKSLSAVGAFSEILDHSANIVELAENLGAIQAVNDRKEYLKIILTDMSSKTTDKNLQEACARMVTLLDNALNSSEVIAVAVGAEGVKVL